MPTMAPSDMQAQMLPSNAYLASVLHPQGELYKNQTKPKYMFMKLEVERIVGFQKFFIVVKILFKK